jgi:hypothetical protein
VGAPGLGENDGTLTVNFGREIPGFVRQNIGYCALPTGEVVVSSHWQALQDVEVAELVDHPFRWVEIEKFISKPDVNQTAPGTWLIDGKLQMQIVGGAMGEAARDGINGSVRRNFSVKAGEVFQSSLCVYQPLVAGRSPPSLRSEKGMLKLGDWNIRRSEDGGLSVVIKPHQPRDFPARQGERE